MPKKKHKNAVEARPSHGLAYHPNRGVRELPLLKSGWRWLTDAEATAFAHGEEMPVTKLRKPGLWRGAVGGIDAANARARDRKRWNHWGH